MSPQDYVNDHQALLATELVDDDDLIAAAIKSITKDVRKRVQPTRAYHETSDALAVVDHFYRGKWSHVTSVTNTILNETGELDPRLQLMREAAEIVTCEQSHGDIGGAMRTLLLLNPTVSMALVFVEASARIPFDTEHHNLFARDVCVKLIGDVPDNPLPVVASLELIPAHLDYVSGRSELEVRCQLVTAYIDHEDSAYTPESKRVIWNAVVDARQRIAVVAECARLMGS